MPSTQPPTVTLQRTAPKPRSKRGTTKALQLQDITGWEQDRRRAVVLLRSDFESANASGAWALADAYWAAWYDLREILRGKAADEIAMGCYGPREVTQ